MHEMSCGAIVNLLLIVSPFQNPEQVPAAPADMSSTPTATAPHERSTSTDDGGQHQSEQRPGARLRIVGDYSLGKTLGAGSMGKVKLASHVKTGKRFAVKLVPRPPPPDAHASGPEAVKQAAKDANKELRTVREAAMSMLVHHPYICAMHELLIQPTQYFMVLEYVSGGQMLDYIIAHGRLRERVARKFARQIASALAYCHANSIVHRDLKIENILISNAGDIKLIDFGLSNLYNPASSLSTFAGSLYFAAPELLNAKPYTGPEVDVWSFGVVLYVLVCGRVPFDDQSMPALHAKIKRGVVEYPPWLSADCKSLLSRILVITPSQRATLSEVLAHPWMNLGYTSQANLHIPSRTPLRADELDPAVVRGMAGFEFGSDAEIMQKLREILSTDAYVRACTRHSRGTTSASTFATTLGSTSSLDVATSSASSVHILSDKALSAPPSALPSPGGTTKGGPGPGGSRRFSGLNFDHYRRKLFSGSTGSGKDGTGSPPGTIPRTRSSSSLVPENSAPAGALDTLDPTRGYHPLISVYFMVREKLERERVAREEEEHLNTVPQQQQQQHQQQQPHVHSRAPTMDAVRESPAPTPAPPREKERLRIPPNIQPPQPMRLAGAEHLPLPPASATTPGTPRARAPESAGPTSAPPASATPVTTASAPLPKPPPASAHRRSASIQKTPHTQQAPWDMEKERVKEPEGLPAAPAVERHHTIQAPPPQGSAIARRFGSIASRRRTSSLIGAPPPAVPPPPREARKSLAEGEVLSDSETGNGVGRWGTIGRRWKGARVNGRTVSGPAPPPPDEKRPMSAGMAGIVDEEEEEHERAAEEERSEAHTTASQAATKEQHLQHNPARQDNFKAVPLKGTFSVATTSTKGAKALRADVRNTLTRMGVAFREIPGGFECSHEPSILASSQKTRPLRKKTSKLSVGPKRRQTAPDEPSTPRRKEKALPDRPATPSRKRDNGDDSVSSSLVHLAAAVRDAYDQQPETPRAGKAPMTAPPSPVAVKVVPPSTPTRRDFAKANPADGGGGGWTDGFKTSPLGVKFEIHIVKVPILPLHGVQFHRVSGDGHQYYMLARRVITELKL